MDRGYGITPPHYGDSLQAPASHYGYDMGHNGYYDNEGHSIGNLDYTLSHSFTHTSPPTPMSQHQEEVRRTRSGRPIGNNYRQDSPQASTVRSTSPKRRTKKNGKPKASTPNLTAPLSELTRDSSVPVRDMEAWVNRPAEDRQREASKRKGYITRPMNSFMLYRSAYAERTKEWCSQNNHQVVSSVSGASWPMEPEHVRRHYDDLAKIERNNHQLAHPNYKFSPAKPGAGGKKRRTDDDALSDADGDWAVSHGVKRPRAGRDASYPARAAPSLPSNVPVYGSNLDVHQYWAPKPQLHPYGATPMHAVQQHYHDQLYRQNFHNPTPPPANHFYQQGLMPDHHRLGYNSGVVGLPGASMHELTDLRSQAPTPAAPIDPQLDHGLGPNPYFPYGAPVGNAHLSYEDTYAFQGNNDTHIPSNVGDPLKSEHHPVQPLQGPYETRIQQDFDLGEIPELDHATDFEQYMGQHDGLLDEHESEVGDKSPKTT